MTGGHIWEVKDSPGHGPGRGQSRTSQATLPLLPLTQVCVSVMEEGLPFCYLMWGHSLYPQEARYVHLSWTTVKFFKGGDSFNLVTLGRGTKGSSVPPKSIFRNLSEIKVLRRGCASPSCLGQGVVLAPFSNDRLCKVVNLFPLDKGSGEKLWLAQA